MDGLRRWFDPGWWSYVRYNYPERLLVVGGLLAVALAVAGYLSVSALGNRGISGSGNGLLTTTVQGRVRTLQVVRTSARLETRTLPGGTRVKRLVRYEPIYRRRVVFRHGKSVTVKEVIGRKAVTVSHVVTQARTVVQSRTQTLDQTRTVVRTQTGPSRTVTVSVTVTGPGATVTETVPVTTTVTITASCKLCHRG